VENETDETDTLADAAPAAGTETAAAAAAAAAEPPEQESALTFYAIGTGSKMCEIP
jgi:hypothetical protein